MNRKFRCGGQRGCPPHRNFPNFLERLPLASMACRAGLRPTAANPSSRLPRSERGPMTGWWRPAPRITGATLCPPETRTIRARAFCQFCRKKPQARQRAGQTKTDTHRRAPSAQCHKRGSAQKQIHRLRAGPPQRVLREDPPLRSIGPRHAFHALGNCPSLAGGPGGGRTGASGAPPRRWATRGAHAHHGQPWSQPRKARLGWLPRWPRPPPGTAR